MSRLVERAQELGADVHDYDSVIEGIDAVLDRLESIIDVGGRLADAIAGVADGYPSIKIALEEWDQTVAC